MSKQATAALFISELYRIGWDSPLDAQHRKITKLLGEWNEPLRNPEQLESSHSRTIEHLDKWISRAHKAEAELKDADSYHICLHLEDAHHINKLEATIRAISDLPDKWHKEELVSRTATPDDPQAMDGDDCADDLQALLKEQS